MSRVKKPGSVRHRWTDKTRTVLVILKRNYVRKHANAIWNFMFRNRLAAEGFQNGIPPTRLDGQFQDIKNGSKHFALYSQIANATDEQVEFLFPDYCSEIRAAATILGADLIRNDDASIPPLNRTLATGESRRLQAVPTPSAPTINVHERSNTFTSSRPNLQHFAYNVSPYFNESHETAQVDHQLNTTTASQGIVDPVSTVSMTAKPLRHPPVLFRATPEIAAFRSRRYHDPAVAIPAPPVFGTKEFKDIVWPHLERDRSYERSPFISLAQNPHNALRRVELARSEEIDQKMFLVIFGFDDLLQDGVNQFGARAGPYLVRSLFTAQEISDLPDGYKGTGEFLVYGAIECEPIAVLESFQAINLARALRHFKHGDLSALLMIHECLQTIPPEWKVTIAQQFLTRYCGKARIPIIGSPAHGRLMHVIYHGTQESFEVYKSHETAVGSRSDSDDDYEYEYSGPDTGVSIEEPQDVDSPLVEASVGLQNALNSSGSHQSVAEPSDELASSWVVVEKLNNIASGNSAIHTPGGITVRKSRYTPLWSPSPSIDVRTEALEPAKDSAAEARANMNDWDMLDDVDFDFSEGLGSAFARKVNRIPAAAFHCDAPIPSIEKTPTPGGLLAGLRENAYGNDFN